MCQEMSQQPDKSKSDLSQIRNSQELMMNLNQLSNILNTGLTQDQLEICIQLCESGVHPTALANIIQQIRREMSQITASQNGSSSSAQN